MNSSSPILSAKNLSKVVNYPNDSSTEVLEILQDISLSLSKGEVVAVTGASGSGKSTLLGLIAGLDQPSTGEVWLNGESIYTLSEDERAARRSRNIGFVFQSFHLLPYLTALENTALPLELTKDPDAHDKAVEMLTRVGLASRQHHFPRQLSGGEQQRVALARAFVTQPLLLFADEPTGNLDRRNGAMVIDLMFSINQEMGTTMVLVTHDIALAHKCQRVLEIEEGRLLPEKNELGLPQGGQ